MAIPPLVLRIYADSSGVKKGVGEAQGQVASLKSNVAKNALAIKAALVGGLAVGAAAAIKAASDLGEAQNKANVVFGKSVGIVNKLGDESAASFGIAKSEALGAASAFGAMFDSAGLAESAAAGMSVKMTKLAGDMASFNNEDPSEMLDRLRSGLSGEAEPLRRFGVFISEARVQTEAYASGIAKMGTELTDAQKIQARYNIILKDTKKQQGDFGRTVGSSLPNQIRVLRARLIDLAAALGKVLLPLALALARALNAIVSPIVKIIEIITTDAWDRFADDLREAGAGAKEVTEKVNALREGVEKTNASLHGLGGIMAAQERATRKSAEAARGWAERQAAVVAQAEASRRSFVDLRGGILRFSQMTDEAFDKWASEAGQNFDAVKGGLDNIAKKAKLTATQVIKEFERQARVISNYRDNLQTVASRNIPDEILQQLIDMGLGGAEMLDLLARVGDRKFAQIVGAMKKASRQTNGVRSDVENLKDSLAGIPDRIPVSIDLTVNGTNAAKLKFGQRQFGGPVGMGQPYIVGEAGPELFVPRTSGTIVSNEQLTTSSVTIHVHGDVNDADRFAQKVEAAVNRAASRH